MYNKHTTLMQGVNNREQEKDVQERGTCEHYTFQQYFCKPIMPQKKSIS